MSEVSIVYIVSNRHFRHVHPVYYKLIVILSRQYHIILQLVGRKYIYCIGRVAKRRSQYEEYIFSQCLNIMWY